MSLIQYAGRTWRWWDDRSLRAPQAQVDIDTQLLDGVAHHGAGATIRLWSNRPCIVVSRRDSRLPEFAYAAAQLAEEGWPVVVRGSGGTAVLHGPGVLNISLIYPLDPGQRLSVASSYQLLCNYVADGLQRLGLPLETSSVPGAFCDGRYNLAVRGRKLAGTAQQVRNGRAATAILSHLSLLVDVDPVLVCERLMRFYALAGVPQHLCPDRITALAAMAPTGSTQAVATLLSATGQGLSP